MKWRRCVGSFGAATAVSLRVLLDAAGRRRSPATGRQLGTPRLVTSPDARALEPRLSATPGGTLLVGWSQQPLNCSADACTAGAQETVMARLIRP